MRQMSLTTNYIKNNNKILLILSFHIISFNFLTHSHKFHFINFPFLLLYCQFFFLVSMKFTLFFSQRRCLAWNILLNFFVFFLPFFRWILHAKFLDRQPFVFVSSIEWENLRIAMKILTKNVQEFLTLSSCFEIRMDCLWWWLMMWFILLFVKFVQNFDFRWVFRAFFVIEDSWNI